MGDVGELGKALKQRRKEDRHRRHRMNYAAMRRWIVPEDVALQRKNKDTHWIVMAFGNRWDFWPSTGLLHTNGRRDCRITFKGLIQRVENLRS